jgi:hypothetical protein
MRKAGEGRALYSAEAFSGTGEPLRAEGLRVGLATPPKVLAA